MEKYNSNYGKLRGFSLISILLGLLTPAAADDWPTYMHDNRRSGVTTEQLQLPLHQDWISTTHRSPRPAWNETPALQDFWHGYYGNKSRVLVDTAFHPVVVGDLLFFGSSNSNKVTCLNARNGIEQWKYFTAGPVRFAPTVYNGRVYFGSDDGFVYCLEGNNGSLVWKRRATNSDELIFANGRMVSVCPVRTAIVVDNGVAYWGAGLFAGAETGLSRFLCAYNAGDGTELWKITPPKPVQGYPLASANNLYVPAGKSTPTMYNLTNGSYLGAFNTHSSIQGGCYALLTNDNKFFFGPHYAGAGPWLGDYNAGNRAYEGIAWFYGNHLVVTASFSYCSSDTTLAKINRSNQSAIWSVPCSYKSALILAGDTLFAGGEDEVAAISTSDGSVLWSAPVHGRVQGLAVANASLFVSTNTGTIHCFGYGKIVPGDIDKNGYVDLKDYARFTLQWMKTGCDMLTNWCRSADITGDGEVGLDDLQMFRDQYLQ